MHLPPDSLGRQPIEDRALEETTVTPESKESEIPTAFQQALEELAENFKEVGLGKQFPPKTEAEFISREEIDELAAQLLESAEGKSSTDPYGVEELAKELESSTKELLKDSEPGLLPPPTYLPPPPKPPVEEAPPKTDSDTSIEVLEESETVKSQSTTSKDTDSTSSVSKEVKTPSITKESKKSPRWKIKIPLINSFSIKFLGKRKITLKKPVPERTEEIPVDEKQLIHGLLENLKEHLSEEGIFRKSGSLQQINDIREKSLDKVSDEALTCHNLAGALKSEIRERSHIFGQQESRILLNLAEGFQALQDGKIWLKPVVAETSIGADGSIKLTDSAITALDTFFEGHQNIEVLNKVLDLCEQIVKEKDTNKMNLNNIAMVFGENLFKIENPDDQKPMTMDRAVIAREREINKKKQIVFQILIAYRKDKKGAEQNLETPSQKEQPFGVRVFKPINTRTHETAGTSPENVDELAQNIILGQPDEAKEMHPLMVGERVVKMVPSAPPPPDEEELEREIAGTPVEPRSWKSATVKADIVARDHVAGVRIGSDRGLTLEHIDEIDKMYKTDQIKLSDRSFMIGFLEASQRYAKPIGRKAIGDDAAFYEGADLKDVWTQETQLATADAMVRAYDKLNDTGKAIAKENINNLAQIGVIPQRLFALFYGRIDEGLVPDIRYEPRQLEPKNDINKCFSELRTAKGDKRETFASDLAAAFKQHQLQKYEKLNISNIVDAQDESRSDAINYFNSIGEFLQTAIVTGGMTGKSPDPRVIRRMIKTVSLVGKKAMDGGDYATALAVLSALESTDVSALIDDYQFDPNGETRKRIFELQRVFDSSGSYSAMRTHIKNNKKEPIVPSLYLICKDLTAINENPDIVRNKFNTEKVKLIEIQTSPLIKMRKPSSKREVVSVPYDLTNLPKQNQGDLLVTRKLYQELAGRPSGREVAIPDNIKKEFQNTVEGRDIDITSEDGIKKLKEFSLSWLIAASALPEVSTDGLEDIKPTAVKTFDVKYVESILSDTSDDITTKGRKLGEYYIEVGSGMKKGDKEQFLKLLAGAKGTQLNLAKGFVEVLLEDDRKHFPLLKDLLQLSFRQEIQSTTDPATLLRGENIGTRMASQAYQILGKEFGEIITSNLREVLPAESLEIQSTRLTDEEKAKSEELIQSRQTQLLEYTTVVYATLTDNIDQMPAEMKELFQMVHDEVKAGGFGEDAARKAFNSQMYLRFVTPAISAKTIQMSTESTKNDKNKQRACMLIAKIITNHTNEKKEPGKEEYMSFMFSEWGDNLSEKMMNLTNAMTTKVEKPKAKTHLGDFVRAAIRRPGLGAKKQKIARGDRPRSMSAGTLGRHREASASKNRMGEFRKRDIFDKAVLSDLFSDTVLNDEQKGQLLAENYFNILACYADMAKKKETSGEALFVEYLMDYEYRDQNAEKVIQGFVNGLLVNKKGNAAILDISNNRDYLENFLEAARDKDYAIFDRTLTAIGTAYSQFLLGRDFFESLKEDSGENNLINLNQILNQVNKQISRDDDFATFLHNVMDISSKEFDRPETQFIKRFVIPRLKEMGYEKVADSIEKLADRKVGANDDEQKLSGTYDIVCENLRKREDEAA